MPFLKKKFSEWFSKENLLTLVKNKYFIAIFVFFVFILFLDEKNLIQVANSKSKLDELKNEEFVLKEKIEVQKKGILDLETKDNVEKLAREQYLMKKDEEDLYLIVKKED
ncbi:MAG: septum formation initiator family protein [Bacteroidales bacterium]|nr:septum formation initiator family protein [Bacteroidales bacterium]